MSEMTFHLCDYCAKTERMRKLLAIVRAAKELRQVWKDKGHGGNAETKAHIEIAKAVDAWEDIARRDDGTRDE